ncbi:MAG: NADH-quinone oxidoreductase subunit I [Pyrodictiaceae archaeon]
MPGVVVDENARIERVRVGGKEYKVIMPGPGVRKGHGVVKGHIDAIAAALYRAVKKPMTLMIPDVHELLPPRSRGVILFDYDKCIGCGLCARICPARAIKMYKVPGDKKIRPGYDMGRCIYCGFCVDICPAEALKHSWLQDHVFDKIEDMKMDPIDWAKFSKETLREEEERRRKYRLVVAVLDEEIGLRYEPVKDEKA